MINMIKNHYLFFLVLCLIFICGCGIFGGEKYDVDKLGIPKFVAVDYIELSKITKISRFRSGIGHDYSDDFEDCRSMKHYFVPYADSDWSSVKIFSPVSGKIEKIFEEWAGTQLWIVPDDYPAFKFIIFHINLSTPLAKGDVVSAGQQLGTHISAETSSDIAVGINTPDGWKLVSYFDVMTDALFEKYQARGVNTRNAAIISKEERDADPLVCSEEGGVFIGEGNIENWVYLQNPDRG